MTQDQIVLLLDLKASKERGASSMSCGLRQKVADELTKLKMIERHSVYGYRITPVGIKWLEEHKSRVK